MANPLHEAFDWAFFRLRPDAPENAIVYEVDAGEPDAPNTIIRAAVFEGDTEPTGAMIGDPIELIIAKAWLAELAVAEGRDRP